MRGSLCGVGIGEVLGWYELVLAIESGSALFIDPKLMLGLAEVADAGVFAI